MHDIWMLLVIYECMFKRATGGSKWPCQWQGYCIVALLRLGYGCKIPLWPNPNLLEPIKWKSDLPLSRRTCITLEDCLTRQPTLNTPYYNACLFFIVFSHNVAAPLSPSKQEVSCFINYGINATANTKWKVVCFTLIFVHLFQLFWFYIGELKL